MGFIPHQARSLFADAQHYGSRCVLSVFAISRVMGFVICVRGLTRYTNLWGRSLRRRRFKKELLKLIHRVLVVPLGLLLTESEFEPYASVCLNQGIGAS